MEGKTTYTVNFLGPDKGRNERMEGEWENRAVQDWARTRVAQSVPSAGPNNAVVGTLLPQKAA